MCHRFVSASPAFALLVILQVGTDGLVNGGAVVYFIIAKDDWQYIGSLYVNLNRTVNLAQFL